MVVHAYLYIDLNCMRASKANDSGTIHVYSSGILILNNPLIAFTEMTVQQTLVETSQQLSIASLYDM